MIKITQLSKYYGNTEILNQIQFSFEEGKIYGIVGKNGSGKTTLFRCIAGLESFSGTIESLHKPLKNHLGYLMTDPYFFPFMTGKEYIQLLCNARSIQIEDIETQNIFNLPLHQYAVQYSTGMKKKLAITALLQQKNKYFILDEPFNGLDIESNLILSEIILRLKKLNKIIIISSHIFSTLSEICDQIHLLENACIAKIFNPPDYPQLETEMKKILVGGQLDKLQLE